MLEKAQDGDQYKNASFDAEPARGEGPREAERDTAKLVEPGKITVNIGIHDLQDCLARRSYSKHISIS